MVGVFLTARVVWGFVLPTDVIGAYVQQHNGIFVVSVKFVICMLYSIVSGGNRHGGDEVYIEFHFFADLCSDTAQFFLNMILCIKHI